MDRLVWRPITSAFLRVTFNRITFTFFLVGFSFCFIQGLIQAFLWTNDHNAYAVMSTIYDKSQVPVSLLPWLTVQHGNLDLKMCASTPYGVKDVGSVCQTVFDTGNPANWTPPPGYRRSIRETQWATSESLPWSRRDSGNNTAVTVTINSQSVSLSEQCTRVLLYPGKRLRDCMSEDIALLVLQFWLLAISSSAILSRSVSHVLAVFIMRVLSTGWSAFTLWRTTDMQMRFQKLVVNADTPCHYDFFPGYFSRRIPFQISDLVLNVVALLFAAIVGWRLVKTFSKNTFNCVGPPAGIIRLYRYLLTISVALWLLLYVMITGIVLVLEVGVLSKAHLLVEYIGISAISVILVAGMVILGTYATRHEKKRLLLTFLIIVFAFLLGFPIMFVLPSFRFTWIQFPFYACLSGVCVLLLACCAVFAILLRMHFGQGLMDYMRVEKVLSDNDFEPDEFSVEDDSKAAGTHQLSNALTEQMSLPVLRRDTTWDFVDVDLQHARPSVYVVEMDRHNFERKYDKV